MLKNRLPFALMLVLLCFVSVEKMKGQELQFGLDFQIGAPQNDFSTQMGSRLGFGIGGMFGYRFDNTPFMVGLDFGFMNFGTETREEPLSSTIPDLRVEVENSYNLFHGDLLVRILAPERAARPYIEGLAGFNHFFTQTVLRERGSFGTEPDKLRDTNFKDTALSYGFGAGLQFRVYSDDGVNRTESDFGGPFSVYIHLASRYMFGREAEYLREGSIIREGGNVTYDVVQSTTDLLHFKIGVTVGF